MRLMRSALVALFVVVLVVVLLSGSGHKTKGAGSANSPGHATTTAAGPPATAAPAHLVAEVSPVALPQAISRSSVAVQPDNSVLILGGLIGSGATEQSTAQILRFDPAAGTVATDGQLASGVHDAAAAVAGQLVVFGGGNAAASVSTVQSVNVGGRGQLVGHLPQARSDLVAVNVGGHAYVLGGYTGVSQPASVLTTDDGSTFRDVAQLPVPVRYPGMAATGSTIYLFGGQTGSSQTADIQAVDVATGTATVIGTLPQAMSEATAWVQRGVVYLAGGKVGTATSSSMRIPPMPCA